MATFGYDNASAAESSLSTTAEAEGTKWQVPADCTSIISFSIRCRIASGAGNIKGLLQTVSGTTYTQVAATPAVAIPVAANLTAAGLTTLTFSSPPAVTPGATVLLAFITDGAVTVYYGQDALAGSNLIFDSGNNYTTPENMTGGTAYNFQDTVLANYTPTSSTKPGMTVNRGVARGISRGAVRYPTKR